MGEAMDETEARKYLELSRSEQLGYDYDRVVSLVDYLGPHIPMDISEIDSAQLACIVNLSIKIQLLCSNIKQLALNELHDRPNA